MVRKLITWVVPGSPTQQTFYAKLFSVRAERCRGTLSKGLPPLQVYAPYAMATHLNAVYFLDPYPSATAAMTKRLRFFLDLHRPLK
jgi:hypothetical protein